jgi:shikimate kinase
MDDQLPDRIYLTGFMGSGKSTIAPMLARELEYQVHELDAAIVAHAGRSIPAVFEESGEAGFRRLERERLEATAELEQMVISLGGGAVTFPSNLRFVREHGYLVYLNVPVEILVDRLSGAEGRPLLTNEEGELLSREQLHEKIHRMLSDRRSYYEQADIIVDAGRPSPTETVKEILKELGPCRG